MFTYYIVYTPRNAQYGAHSTRKTKNTRVVCAPIQQPTGFLQIFACVFNAVTYGWTRLLKNSVITRRPQSAARLRERLSKHLSIVMRSKHIQDPHVKLPSKPNRTAKIKNQLIYTRLNSKLEPWTCEFKYVRIYRYCHRKTCWILAELVMKS